MDVLPHIDVAGDARIQQILDQPGNYLFDADACETLDGWVPDIGLTNYPNLSIFRPPSVARAGIRSTIRHRFWSTLDGETDHTGRRYIGVVLYDGAGEECPLEFRLGADDIGRIVPARHDNRRHLIVIDQPVEFHGEMEVFQVTASGTGTYRIETFALLRERPMPSDFAPRIDHLTARVIACEAASVTAEIHCTTSQVATCEVVALPAEAGEAAHPAAREDRPAKLHVISLTGLLPERQYTLHVTATEPAGASADAQLMLFTAAAQPPSAARIAVPVELLVPLEAPPRDGLPLTFGAPLPQGQLYAVGACHVRAGEQVQPAQARIHAHWPDGSARWALIDTACPQGLPAGRSMPMQVELAASRRATNAPASPALTWDAGAAGISVATQVLRVAVRRQQAGLAPRVERCGANGSWRTVITADEAPAPTAVLGDGRQLWAGVVSGLALEEAGGERAVIRYEVPHQDSAGVTHLVSTVRVQVYARQPFMTLSHRLTVVSPELPPAAGGAVPGGFKQGTTPNTGANDEARTLLAVRSATLRLPCAGHQHIHCAGQLYPLSAAAPWRLRQEHDQAYRMEANGAVVEHAGRAAGWIAVDGAAGRLLVGIRHFWESYPNGLAVHPDGIDVELLPALAGTSPPGDADAWHRLDFWRDDGCYQLKAGLALRRDVLLAWPDAEDDARSTAIQAWFNQPPFVRPALDWLNASHALLSPLAPKADSPVPGYEALVDAALDDWLTDTEHLRAYGFLNFGDWYGESLWSWGNNEYDAAFSHYCEFLRGGAPGWFALAGQAARHLADVDTCNYSANPAQVGGQYMHMPGHAGGYLPPYFRSKIAGSTMLPSHMWVEGTVLHYLLTGDEHVRDTLQRTASWLIRGDGPFGLDHYDFTNLRECGWHLIHLSGIAQLTSDPRYVNAAWLIIERVLERQGANGGWDHQLTLSHCACPPPRHRGEAGFMAGILLAGLRRWHELTGEARIAEAIIRGAHWLIASTYDEASGEFRYTSCPNKRTPGFEYTIPVLEGLAYAYALSGDGRIGGIVTRGFAALGAHRDNLGHSGFGKALCWQTRFVPIALAHWQHGQRAPASRG